MMPQFLFNRKTTKMPNVNGSLLFKNWHKKHGREYHTVVELDLQLLAKSLNVSEEQAKETATKVVESIWRLKNDRV